MREPVVLILQHAFLGFNQYSLSISIPSPTRIALKRHKSLRQTLRERGQLSQFWKAHKLDMIHYTQDCSADQPTDEPLLNYFDVSGCALRGDRNRATTKEANHPLFVHEGLWKHYRQILCCHGQVFTNWGIMCQYSLYISHFIVSIPLHYYLFFGGWSFKNATVTLVKGSIQ